MNPTDHDRMERIARQDLRALQMLGVEFVLKEPRKRGQGNATPAAVEGASEVPSGGSTGKAHSTDKSAALDALRHRHDERCPHCTVATSHTQCVFGEGNPDARIMFIGEAPGEEEDRTGRPFVGRAGQLLDKIIDAMGLSRADVYIANVLKSRPPNNRAPLAPEIEGCGPFLTEQIRIIQPEAIVTLGGPATKLVLGTDIGITRLRGQWAEYCDPDGALSVPVMPTFHPAYLLRNYTPEVRKQVWSDMQAVLKRLGLPMPQRTGS